VLRRCAFCIRLPELACRLLICIVIALSAVSATAQTAPQSLYGSTASQLAGFSKGSDGALTPFSGTPFSDPQFQGGAMAIDGLGQFLLLIDHASSGVWMFRIQGDGTLVRTPGSPFFAPAPGNVGPAPSSPVSLATELSGQFLYVGYQSGSAPGYGAVIEFQIDVADPANPQLIPVPAQQSSYIQASPLEMLADPKGAHLYVALAGAQAAGTNVYAIDAGTGAFNFVGTAGGGNPNMRAIALDPRAQFFFDGWGSNAGFIESAQVSPTGTTVPLASPISLGPTNLPSAMLVDGSGKFLYVDVLSAGGSFVFPIDSTGILGSPPLGPLTAFNFQTGTAVADPQAPYIYSLQPDGIHSFAVDAVSGAVSDVNGSPFPVVPGSGNGVGGLAISGASGQAITGAVAQLFPPSQDFGQIAVGQTGGTKLLSLTNIGSVPVNLTAVSVGGANAGDFLAAPSCPLPAFLPAGNGNNATCSISVTFTPAAGGARQAILTTTTGTAGTQSTRLTGTGITGLSAITISPASLSFPSTVQGATSAAQMVTLTNSAVATLHISSVAIGGSNAGDFTMTNGCNGAYAANASCTINVTFSPLADGPRSAFITITDDVPGSPQTVPITGSGGGAAVGRPAMTIAPTTVSFAGTPSGTTSAPQNVTLTNSGTAALHITSVQVGGANAGDFSLTNGCTAAAYAANASCIVSVKFSPSAIGIRVAALTITDDAIGSPHIVQVTGASTGGAALMLSAAAFTFAAIPVGTTSPQQNVTITSSGSAALHIFSVLLSGGNAGEFKLDNGCTAPAYLAPTACTLGLTFTPSAAGSRAATLTVADDAPNSPQTIAVSGNANPLLTVAAATGGSFSATVIAGHSAAFNLLITAGFDGSVSFACSGAPLAATCSVPTSTKVASGTPATVVITVATVGSAGASRLIYTPTDEPFDVLGLRHRLMFLYFLAVAMLCATAIESPRSPQRTRARPRLAYPGVAASLAAIALCAMAGCGGASTSAQSAPITQAAATPPGTSTITVSFTATTSAGTLLPPIAPIQLTLTVN